MTDMQKETLDEKKKRMEEVKEGCKKLKNNRKLLRRHHINPEPLIKELRREGNVLTHDIGELEKNEQ